MPIGRAGDELFCFQVNARKAGSRRAARKARAEVKANFLSENHRETIGKWWFNGGLVGFNGDLASGFISQARKSPNSMEV